MFVSQGSQQQGQPISGQSAQSVGKSNNKAAKDLYSLKSQQLIDGFRAYALLARYSAKSGKSDRQTITFNRVDDKGGVIASNVQMEFGKSELTELFRILIDEVRNLRKLAFRLNKTTRRSNERFPGFLSLSDIDPRMINFFRQVQLGNTSTGQVKEVLNQTNGRMEMKLAVPASSLQLTNQPLLSVLTFLQQGELANRTNSGTLTTLFAIYRNLNAAEMILPNNNTRASRQMRLPLQQGGLAELMAEVIRGDIARKREEFAHDPQVLQELAQLEPQLINAIGNPNLVVTSARFLPTETSQKSIFNPNSFKFSHFTKLNAKATKKPSAEQKEVYEKLALANQQLLKRQADLIFLTREFHNAQESRQKEAQKAQGHTR